MTVTLDAIQGTTSHCGNPVKFKVETLDNKGRKKVKFYCGVHKNSVVKTSDRVAKMTNYNKYKAIVTKV